MKKCRRSNAMIERRARQHFENRWREKISPEVPRYDLLKEVVRKAGSGQPQTFVTFLTHRPPHSSRWIATWQGKKVVIAYDHSVRLPMTCWPYEEPTAVDVVV